MIESQLPALQVVLPLLGAVFCALLRNGRLAWAITMAVSLVMPVISGLMLAQVLTAGPISYALGGWVPPYGIEYRVDALSGTVLLLVSSMSAIMVPYALRSIAHEVGPTREAWFYCMYLISLTGLLGITITGDAFNAFVFLEISSIAGYAMIALGRDRRALLAAYQYLILGTIGASFYVIGIGFLYAMTGTLNLVDLGERLGDVIHTRSAIAALGFITVGLSLKLALFPLHVWLPSAYRYAPSFVTAFLAATATKVAAYLLLRFLFVVFGAVFVEDFEVPLLIIALCLAGLFGASIVAIFQDDVKLMLAYSSVAQIGLIVLGFGIANQAGLTGSVVHLLNHAFMKGAMFLAVGAVFYRLGTVQLSDFAGLGRKMPLTMTALTIGGLSMVGVPGTVGFISKWWLGVGALERDWWWLLVLIVASSLLSLVYVGRLLEVVWLRQPKEGAVAVRDPPPSMLLPTLVLAALCIYFGLDTEITIGLASAAAELLLGGPQ
jgi:multicomponent Na+:H+ antiporter subunit D